MKDIEIKATLSKFKTCSFLSLELTDLRDSEYSSAPR